MSSRTTVRAIAAAALAGLALAGSVAAAGMASAAPADHPCTADQVVTSLHAGDPGAGQRYAYVQFTAKAGQSCTLQGALPVNLADAPGITVSDDRSTSSVVTIADGRSARMLLHWTGIEDSAHQVTPSTVRIALAENTAIVLPWSQGAMDDSADAHDMFVSSVEAGAAPAY